MYKLLDRIFLLNSDEICLERKIFIATSFLATLLSIFSSIVNLIIFRDTPLLLLSLLFVFIFFLFFSIGKKSVNYKKYVNIFIIITSALLSVLWFFNGGIDSANIVLIFLFFTAALIIIEKKNRIALIVLYMLITSLLIISSYYFPDYVNPYISQEQRFFDFVFSYPFFLLINASTIIVLVDNYQKEKNKVHKQKKELKITMDRLEHSNEELTTLVENIEKESTYLLKLNDKLAISEQKLKKSNETKDRIFSIIAHDLKNPLHGISLASQLLDVYIANNQEAMETNDNIKAMIKDLNILLEDLLAWSRSQTGDIDFNPTEVDFKTIIEESLYSIKNIALYKEINIIYNSPESKNISVDANMINAIIRNLLSNAIKFTKFGGEISINVETYSKDNSFILVSVKDNGVGINPDKLSKLFTLEKIESSPGTINEKGSGFGLILCKEFIEKHNGAIWAESELGKGSVFYFTLPLSVSK